MSPKGEPFATSPYSHKFPFDRDGKFIDWFSTATKPDGPKIKKALEAALK
jgi:hypothetical protein